MHQSIPAAPSPPPPRAYPRASAFFLRWMADSHWRGKRGQIPCPQSTLQHFSLIAQSNSAVLKHFNSVLTRILPWGVPGPPPLRNRGPVRTLGGQSYKKHAVRRT